jgi:hypothetical protein
MATDWNDIRAVRYSTMTPPSEGPPNVRPISMEGVNLLGIDPATNRLYWDGKQAVLTDRVVTLGSFERFFVALAAIGIWGIFITDLLNWVSTFATPEGPPPIHRSIGQ